MRSPALLCTLWLGGVGFHNNFFPPHRNHFYQFGEIRTITVVQRQQCAFIQFATRQAAEVAAEKSFNKLIVNGRRLNVKWGRWVWGEEALRMLSQGSSVSLCSLDGQEWMLSWSRYRVGKQRGSFYSLIFFQQQGLSWRLHKLCKGCPGSALRMSFWSFSSKPSPASAVCTLCTCCLWCLWIFHLWHEALDLDEKMWNYCGVNLCLSSFFSFLFSNFCFIGPRQQEEKKRTRKVLQNLG